VVEEDAPARWPQAFVAVDVGTPRERVVPVHDVLVIGRECAGVDGRRRLLVDDETVSRRHVELRLDLDNDCACLFDTSTNGTRLNGARIERATEVRIRPGDRVSVGATELEFRADRFFGVTPTEQSRSTVVSVSKARMGMVAGDLVAYSTISQYTDEDVLLKNVDRLYRELCDLVDEHRGQVNHYAGDAFFAVWELDGDEDAGARAAAFAIAADERVRDVAPALELRTPDGAPVRMGWGIELGPVAVSMLPGGHLTVLGDATNLAFRLSTSAGREGRATVLATERAEAALRDRFTFRDPIDLAVKGREGTERVFALCRA